MSKPDTFFGDAAKPVGGHVLGHTATFLLYLRKGEAHSQADGLTQSVPQRGDLHSDHGRGEGLILTGAKKRGYTIGADKINVIRA